MRRIFAKSSEGSTWSGPGIQLLPELSERLHAGEGWDARVDGRPITLAQIDAILDRCRIPGGEYIDPREEDWTAVGVA